MKENKEETNNEVKLDLSEIELPKIDMSVYVGKKTRISKISTHKGIHGYYIKLTSSVIDVVEFGKEEKELVASKIFSLHTDRNGLIGWGKETQLGEYLVNKGVKHPDELLGKEVVVQMNVKNGTEFLTFI